MASELLIAAQVYNKSRVLISYCVLFLKRTTTCMCALMARWRPSSPGQRGASSARHAWQTSSAYESHRRGHVGPSRGGVRGLGVGHVRGAGRDAGKYGKPHHPRQQTAPKTPMIKSCTTFEGSSDTTPIYACTSSPRLRHTTKRIKLPVR